MKVKNWAGNVTFAADRMHRPRSIPELQEIVAGSARAHALGGGHSFSRVADTTGDLIAVDRLPSVIDIDRDAMTVVVSAGTRYAELANQLQRNGLALRNLGSLPHISVAGACSTATHGSGDTNEVLAGSVNSLTLATADGNLTRLSRGDGGFDGAVVGLGALGIITSLTLDVRSTFDVEQRVYEGLTWESLLTHLHAILASGYSVSIFTRWDDHSQVWVKRRCGDSGYDLTDTTARAARGPRHPVPELRATNCTEQLGIPAPWHHRLPHFRPEFRPATGDELQSEYFVAKTHAVAALESVRRIRARVRPVLQTSEIRTVASDELWLSPSYHRDSIALHFTWCSDMAKVTPVLADVEDALAPFDPRPHWGKLFSMRADELAASYPKWSDFGALMRRLDPVGKFTNDFVDDHFTPVDSLRSCGSA